MNISLLQYRWAQLPASPAIPQVPEPETYLTMGAGLALVALWKRRSNGDRR